MLQLISKFPLEKGIKAWFGPILTFVPLKPEDIKIILNSEHCQDKPLFVYNQLFTYGMISMNGDEYKNHRKAILPLFYPKTLQSFLPILDGLMKKFLVDFELNLKPETFDLKHDSMDFMLNANLITSFGIHIEKETRKNFMKSSSQ